MNTKFLMILMFTATLIYLMILNYNLPFLAYDELCTVSYSLQEIFDRTLLFGRASQLIGIPISWIMSFKAPTLLELTPRYFSMVLVFITFIIYLKHIRFSSIHATWIASFILLSHEIDWQHNGLIAFFGNYNIYISFFIISIVMYEKFVSSKLINILIFLSLFISFSSELFVGLATIYLLTMIITEQSTRAIKNPFGFAVIFYLIFYVIIHNYSAHEQALFMRDYLAGSTAHFTTVEILIGFILYFVHSIPFYWVLNIADTWTPFIGILIIILFGIIISLYLRSYSRDKETSKYRTYISALTKHHVFIWLALIFIPQFLLALQPMKLEWILKGQSHHYAFSFYSFASIVILSVILLRPIIKLLQYKKIIYMSFYFLSLTCMIYSVIHNIAFTKNYDISMNNWLKIDSLLKNEHDSSCEIPAKYLVHPFISEVSDSTMKKYVETIYAKRALICSPYSEFLFNQNVKIGGLELEGFANPEEFGRWTDSGNAKILFIKPLEANSYLELTFSQTIGENDILPTKLKIGNTIKEIIVKPHSVYRIKIEKDIEHPTLEIIIAKPTTPLSLNMGKDTRKLGVALQKLRIGSIVNGKFIPLNDKLCY